MADQEAKDKVFGQNLLDDSHSGGWKTQDSSRKIEKKKKNWWLIPKNSVHKMTIPNLLYIQKELCGIEYLSIFEIGYINIKGKFCSTNNEE